MSPCDLRTFSDIPQTLTLSSFLSDCCAVNNAEWMEREREREGESVWGVWVCLLSPQKRRHPVCPELMFPAHVDYIMTYYSIILLKCIFCLCKSYTVPYLILFLSHTYNSHSFCTTYLIRFKYLFLLLLLFLFLFLLIQMCTTCEQPSCNCFGNTNV